MDRLAAPAPGDTEPGPVPEQTARDLGPGPRPRYEPRNMTFADGLDRWVLGGTFSQHASQAHWADYTCAAEDGAAALSAAVPDQPASPSSARSSTPTTTSATPSSSTAGSAPRTPERRPVRAGQETA